MATLLGSLRRAVNLLLNPLGFELTRLEHNWADGRNYIPYGATVAAAAAACLSVSDYVEDVHNRRGVTAHAIQEIAALGVYSDGVRSVCEIGPGSGRYLERTIGRCHPGRYEIYETAKEWAAYLVKTYGVMLRPTNGKNLAATPDRSIDLVQAHKVFVTTSTLTTCSYLREMARVVRDGGWVIFDILSEACLDRDTLEGWLAPGSWPDAFPNIMPRDFVIRLLADYGLMLRGSFFIEMRPGKTECLVFQRCAGASDSAAHVMQA